MATKNSLASAIVAAGKYATKNDSSAVNSSDTRKNYASSRAGLSMGSSVSLNMNRYSQMSGGLNTMTTAPNFYSPFLTPSSFQIPNARREVYLWANWWRNNEPKVAAAMNFYTNYPFSGWKLECSSSYVKDYFEKLVEHLNFQKWLPEISKVYHLLGDSFVLLSIDCPHCQGSNWDNKKNEACRHDGATWKSISILNPDNVLKTPGMIDQQGSYSYKPSPEEIRLVNERQPKEIYESIPDNVKKMIMKGDPIKLNPISIYHFKYGSNPWEDYGTPMIRSLFPTLTYKDKLRQAQFIVAERMILPIKLVKVGTDTRPASQEDIDSVQDELAAIANDPNLTLVTHHAFEMDYVGASGKIHTLSNEFELIEQEILDGVMLNKLLLNGEGPAYSSGQVGLLAMEKRIDTFRNEVAHWIEQHIFKPVAEWNGFIVEGERGQEELVYPKIKFDSLDLRDDTGKLQTLVTANQNGVISNVTLIESFGFDPDQEIERLRFEQGSNFMSDSNFGTPNFSFNMQSGPVTGQGFGSMTPGMPQPGMPEAGAPMPTADTKLENYRIASSIVNDIYNERLKIQNEKTKVRTASRNIKSAAHEGFLHSLYPVSGRGNLGPLPDEYDGLFGNIYAPELGGVQSCALNYESQAELNQAQQSDNHLVREVIAAKKDKPQAQLFTSIEKTLYGLLLSMNMPYALYAQYSAGPTGDYQLDAAIPMLKIGLEADGGIWHNNPEKIAKDKRRDSELATQGWVILRFTDKELKDHPQDCLNVVLQAIRKRSGSNGEGKQTL